ncbi:MAG: protoporphyrinogen oxidase [Alphaproteobacteria bacterium]|nr:protoporphyrinogen oxidase [Alphaproteobacteria bacterium]
MNILLVYGSTEGQTRKIAEFCAERLGAAGHVVDLRDSRRRMVDLELSAFDMVILAGSVHQKTHQESLANFTIAHRKALKSVPTLLISVSLAIAFENGEAEARGYTDSFAEYVGFEPTGVVLVAGALKFDEYDYYMNQIVEHVVLENRGEIEGDREFTDWDKLGDALDSFVTGNR